MIPQDGEEMERCRSLSRDGEEGDKGKAKRKEGEEFCCHVSLPSCWCLSLLLSLIFIPLVELNGSVVGSGRSGLDDLIRKAASVLFQITD